MLKAMIVAAALVSFGAAAHAGTCLTKDDLAFAPTLAKKFGAIPHVAADCATPVELLHYSAGQRIERAEARMDKLRAQFEASK